MTNAGMSKMVNAEVRTRSGLPVRVVALERAKGDELAAREHPRLVRLTHWLNAVSLTVMTMSGLQIFMAFPSFGPKIPQSDLVHVPEAFRLGGWLGGALQWHFTFAWLFTITGIVYGVYLVLSGHWRHVVLQPRELRGIWPMARHYFLFKPKPDAREPYNPLQKLAYTSTILLGALAVVTGLLLAKPVQFAPVVALAGGFRAVRIYHFVAMAGFLAFIPGHLVMVALHGWSNFASMWTGWKRRPDYLDPASLSRR
jgi:thiosulfate reductase cytochrome b subunit